MEELTQTMMQEPPKLPSTKLNQKDLHLQGLKDHIVNRLKNETLIDIKNKKGNELKFCASYVTSGLFTDAEVIAFIEMAERLLKRSDNNIETLIQLLEELRETDIDLTSHIESLQSTLSNQAEKSLRCLQLAYGQIKNAKTLVQTTDFIQKGLASTNDEAKKLLFVALLTGTTKSLKYLQTEDKASVQDAVLQVLSKGVEAVTTDEQFTVINTILEQFFRYGSKEYVLPANLVGSFKKLSCQNRFTASYVNIIGLNHLKQRKAAAQEEQAIHDIAESIFQYSVSANLKNFGKTVSQPLMFFSGLTFILLYVHYCEDEAPTKLVTAIHKEIQEKQLQIFSNKSHFQPLKYLVGASTPESQLLGESFFLLYAIYQDEFADQSVQFKFEFFSTILNLVSFSGKTRNFFSLDAIREILHEILVKKETGYVQLFIDVFYVSRWYLYTINPYRHIDLTFRKDRLNEFYRVLVKMLVHNIREDPEFIFGIPSLDDLFLTLSNEYLSTTWINHLTKVITKADILGQLLTTLLESKVSKPYFWVSQYGLDSRNPHSHVSIIKYCTFLVNIGADKQLVSDFLPLFDHTNIDERQSLEQINSEFKEFINDYKTNEDPHIEELLKSQGVQYYVNHPPEDQEDEEMRQLIQRQKSGKRGESLQMMDEGEAAEQQIKQHKARFINYFSLVTRYLEAFHRTSSVDAREWFFINYHEKLIKLCRLEGLRLPYLKLALPYLRKTKLTEPFAYALVDFNIQRSIGQAWLDTKTLQKLLEFQQTLVNTEEVKSFSTLETINALQRYVLFKNDFEVRNKQLAMQFAIKYSEKSKHFAQNELNSYYEIIVNNINICAHVKESYDLINLILANNENKHEHYLKIFEDILNLVEEAKILALRCLDLVEPATLPMQFGFALKLRVLHQGGSFKVVDLAKVLLDKLPSFDQYLSTLVDFDFTDFARRNAREHLEYATKIFSEYLKTKSDWTIITQKALDAAKHLESTLVDAEEILLFFPYFISVCVQHIPEELSPNLIDLLIGQYSRLDNRQQLVEKSIEAGVALIKQFGATNHKAILPMIEKYLKASAVAKKKQAPVQQGRGKQQQAQNRQQQFMDDVAEHNNASTNTSVSAMIFLGVLSPNLASSKDQLLSIQQQILELLRSSPRQTQVNLAKCLGDLLSFFPDAENLIKESIVQSKVEVNLEVKRGQAFLVAGLLRGMGVQKLEELRILQQIDETSGHKKETTEEKQANLFQLEAIVEIFGRLAEPYYVEILAVLMKYFGDAKEEIRQISLNATKIIMAKLTGYGVKIILPHLFQGIEENKSWRGKVANIWALGNMAYCSPKQLSSNLPLIVSSISKAISDTHPEVRRSANESLEQIGSTIQNPEISSIAQLLIKSLSNPFDENLKGLELILSTNFAHYIDAPALSLLIPIIDYGLRSQDSMQKEQAARVVGSMSVLIKDAYDLVPYMNMIVGGLEVALGDPIIEVRTLAAQAIGRLSSKIGIPQTEKFFGFIWKLLETQEIATIKRSGAANSLAEIICAQDTNYFESQLQKIFEQTQAKETYVKEGYVGTFIYMPGILKEKFEPYVKDVIDNIQELVTNDDDTVRSISLRVLKILIQNYAISQNELLYPILHEAMKNEFWKRRNAAVILSGEMLDITHKIVAKQMEKPTNTQYINYELYVQNLMLLYILRHDDAEQVRMNATNIWKQYIDNTPRLVKRGLRHMIQILSDMMTRQGLFTIGVTSVQSFCQKYGESHFGEVLDYLDMILSEDDNLSMITGAYMVMTQFYKHCEYDVLTKFSDKLLTLSRKYILSPDHSIKKQLFQSVGQMITKLRSTNFVEDLIEPYLKAISQMTEEDPEYPAHLEIFDELCSLNQQLILQFLIVLILEAPLEQYKIDILTNNARTFAQVMFTQNNGVIPITVLFKEVYGNTGHYKVTSDGSLIWPNRIQSLIYCIGQISINLKREPVDLVAEYLRDIIEHIEKYSKSLQNNHYDLVVAFELLQYFLHNSPEPFQTFASTVIEKSAPFLFAQAIPEQQNKVIYSLVNKILCDINNTMDRDQHHKNLSSIHTCLFNRINNSSFTGTVDGFNERDGLGVKPYVEMLISNIVYGEIDIFNHSIYLIEVLLQYTDTVHLQQHILKIMGAIIRILNYRLPVKQKISCLQAIHASHVKGLNLAQFAPQLQVTYGKIVIEMNQDPDQQNLKGLKQLAHNYSQLIKVHPRKDLLLNEIFNKVLQAQTDETRECHLVIVKTMLKHDQQLFSKALLERIFNLCKHIFESKKYRLAKLIGDIIGLTWAHSNHAGQVNLQEKYLNKFTTDDSVLLLFASAFRYAPQQGSAESLFDSLKAQLNSRDTLFLNQVIKLLSKLKKANMQPFNTLGDLRQLVSPDIWQESQLLSATMLQL